MNCISFWLIIIISLWYFQPNIKLITNPSEMRTTYTESCQRSNRPPNSGDHTSTWNVSVTAASPHVDVPPKTLHCERGHRHRHRGGRDNRLRRDCVNRASHHRYHCPRPGSYGPSTSSLSLSLLSLGGSSLSLTVGLLLTCGRCPFCGVATALEVRNVMCGWVDGLVMTMGEWYNLH